MNYSYSAFQAITGQWVTYFAAGGSLFNVYRDHQAFMGSGGISAPNASFYAEINNLIEDTTVVVLGLNKLAYRAEVIFEIMVPQLSTAITGYSSEPLTDSDRNYAGALSSNITIGGILANYFDQPIFAPPVLVPGDLYELISLRLHSEDRPVILASGKKLYRFHIYWKFRQA